MTQTQMDSLENKIELLKKTLEFYADGDKYVGDDALIGKDKGHMARHTLDLIKIIEDKETKIETLVEKIKEATPEEIEETVNKLLKQI